MAKEFEQLLESKLNFLLSKEGGRGLKVSSIDSFFIF